MALKNVKIDNCERSEEMRGLCESRSVPESNLLHSSYCGVIVSYYDEVVGTRDVEPRLKRSVQSHGIR